MIRGRLQLLCFCALFAVVHTGPMEYELQQNCNGTISTFSSALLTVKGWWWAQSECAVKIHASHNINSYVRLEVLDIRALCASHWVTLYDGPPSNCNYDCASPRLMSPNLCDDTWSAADTMYISSTDTITIKLSAPPFMPSDSYFDVKLLATSTADSSMYGDFECDNMYNVISELTCDGYNNCGDRSDEAHDLCHRWGTRHVIIIAGSSAGGVFIIVLLVVIVAVRRCRRQSTRAARLTAIKSDLIGGKGSIQDEVNPAGGTPPLGYTAPANGYEANNFATPLPASYPSLQTATLTTVATEAGYDQ